MLVSYNWLKDYVDFDFSPQELADKLTNLGFETANLEKIDDDTIIDLELTVNRGDCLSMIGLAREISAITQHPLKMPTPPAFTLSKKLINRVNVSLVEPKLCPRYTGRIIDGVKVSTSPLWLKNRLERVGIKSINNVVDITNFVMMELGQPLHAFDYHTIRGNKVIICLAAMGEKITALNGITYALSPEMLIIADVENPLALAGIIGGENCRVKEETTTIFLECAYFDPTKIRQTAKLLDLQTESSFRFERGVDPEGLIRAQNRATQLIVEICKGKSVADVIDEYPKKFKKIIIDLSVDRINRKLGTKINEKEIKDILQPLGFEIKQENNTSLQIEVPSFRQLDVTREIDLIEEIARVYGYDKISTSLPRGSFRVAIDYEYELINKVKEILVSCGFYEVITYVFTSPTMLLKTKIPIQKEVVINNPLREDENLLCPSLIPNILKVLIWNINRNNNDLKIFELGRGFLKEDEKLLPKEKEILTGAIVGNYQQPNWRDKANLSNLYDLKGVIEKLLLELGITDYEVLTGNHPTLYPSKQIKLVYQGITFGNLGELHSEVAEALKLPKGIYLFELQWDDILKWVNLEKKFKPLPKYPAVHRDLSVLIKKNVTSEQVTRIIEEVGRNLIAQVRLFDLYQGGDKIPEGYKSLAYSVTYRKHNATLTDEEVNKVHHKIILELKNTLGAQLREPPLNLSLMDKRENNLVSP